MKNANIKDVIKGMNQFHKIKIRVKKMKDGRLSVFLDTHRHNAHHYEFLKLYLYQTGFSAHNDNTLRLVARLRDDREALLQESETGIPTRREDVSFIRFARAVISEKNESTAEQYTCGLTFWIKTHGERLTIRQIDRYHVDKFLSRMKADRLSQATRFHYFFAVKYILKQAVKDRIIQYNPADDFSVSQGRSVREFLSMDEVRQLVDLNTGDPVRDAFLFSCYTGLRYSDIIALTWNQIRDNHLAIKQQKTGEYLRSPLTEPALAILDSLRTTCNMTGKVFKLPSYKRLREHLKKLMDAAGIDRNITFHCARHTFATLCLTYGMDLYTVSKLLGHTDIGTTQLYAKIVDSKKEEEVRKFPKI